MRSSSGGGRWTRHAEGSRAEAVQEALRTLEYHPVIAHYRPDWIGEGSERAAFSFPEHPKLVGKVFFREIRGVIEYNTSHDLAPDALSDEVRKEMERRERSERMRYRSLREYFGEMVLRERGAIVRIPMSDALARVIAGESTPSAGEGESYEVPVRLRIQERIPDEAFASEAQHLRSSYLERKVLGFERYVLIAPAFDSDDALDAYIAYSSSLTDLQACVEQSSSAHALLSDFVARCMRYSNDLGEILDLVGSYNAIMFQESDTKWRICLADALSPQENAWTTAIDVIDRLKQCGEIDTDARERSALLNTLSYVRWVNAAAKIVGIRDRLRVPFHLTGDDWREIYREISDSSPVAD